MTPESLKELRKGVERLIAVNQDDYAEILALTDRDSLAFIEVEAVISFAGYTPTSFMVAWGTGRLDV